MDFVHLRNVLHTHIAGANISVRHQDIPGFCRELGLSEPIPESEGTKAERLVSAFAATPDNQLPHVANQIISCRPPSPEDRNVLQDLIWPAGPPVPKRYRRGIARSLETEDLFRDAAKFDELLQSLFVVCDPFGIFFGPDSKSLQAQIERHVHRNPGDWSVEYLFERLKVLEATDARFVKFLEGLVSPDVMPDIAAQRSFVDLVSPPLTDCGLEFRETGEQHGYPVFQIIEKQDASAARPKNIIFASAAKPDLRFKDAVNNDIEIASNADKVLVYDRAIPHDGIRWCDLKRPPIPGNFTRMSNSTTQSYCQQRLRVTAIASCAERPGR